MQLLDSAVMPDSVALNVLDLCLRITAPGIYVCVCVCVTVHTHTHTHTLTHTQQSAEIQHQGKRLRRVTGEEREAGRRAREGRMRIYVK
jgi:hypothetical protein